MNESNEYVVFALDERRYALPLPSVERAVRAVEVTPLPRCPEIVLGVIDMQGQVIPVINMRKRFGLQERDVDLGDQLLIAHTTKRTVALLVDSVMEVVKRSGEDVVATDKIVPGTAYVDGVVRVDEGLALIYDLDTVLSLEEEDALKDAIRETSKVAQ